MENNRFIFDAPEPIAAYVGSLFPLLPIPDDTKLHADMYAWAARLHSASGINDE